jgi:hypothetical protein
MEGQYPECCIIMSAQNVIHDSSLVSSTEMFNTCLKCFLRTACSFPVLTQCLSHERKVAESFTKQKKNLASTVPAREAVCNITFSKTLIPRLAVCK